MKRPSKAQQRVLDVLEAKGCIQIKTWNETTKTGEKKPYLKRALLWSDGSVVDPGVTAAQVAALEKMGLLRHKAPLISEKDVENGKKTQRILLNRKNYNSLCKQLAQKKAA